jgi:hypothetical protein
MIDLPREDAVGEFRPSLCPKQLDRWAKDSKKPGRKVPSKGDISRLRSSTWILRKQKTSAKTGRPVSSYTSSFSPSIGGNVTSTAWQLLSNSLTVVHCGPRQSCVHTITIWSARTMDQRVSLRSWSIIHDNFVEVRLYDRFL